MYPIAADDVMNDRRQMGDITRNSNGRAEHWETCGASWRWRPGRTQPVQETTSRNNKWVEGAETPQPTEGCQAKETTVTTEGMKAKGWTPSAGDQATRYQSTPKQYSRKQRMHDVEKALTNLQGHKLHTTKKG